MSRRISTIFTKVKFGKKSENRKRTKIIKSLKIYKITKKIKITTTLKNGNDTQNKKRSTIYRTYKTCQNFIYYQNFI